jgi:16S rRNA A1518/A1519 N6-dimethyltransferase RsmA/KsgA/DIM1 with predicted DNA glycosylase/AP lyase activity
MILDPTGRLIKNITGQCDINGKKIFEIGCGSGRITRDLAAYAGKAIAINRYFFTKAEGW